MTSYFVKELQTPGCSSTAGRCMKSWLVAPRVTGRLILLDLIDEGQIFVHPIVPGGGSTALPTVAERQGVSLVAALPFWDAVSLRHTRQR